jgi:ubiquinone/menaquinone biosynthesis C-methylase UbiE
MGDFYVDTLRQLVRENRLRPDMRILVLCGGRQDQEALQQAGFSNVTIANLDTRMTGQEFAPYAWSFQDAENITFADNEFDFGIVHNGLHHCYSPHGALLELYRVSKFGVLIFEPRDNWFTRLGVRLNFGQDYEVAAVFGNACTFGGVRNTEVPNYVYRWNEREVEKAINCYYPYGRNRFRYFYHLRPPWERLQMMRNKFWLTAIIAAYPLLLLYTLLFPRQSNNFAFAAFKPAIPQDLHPWIQMREGQPTLDKSWVTARYG